LAGAVVVGAGATVAGPVLRIGPAGGGLASGLGACIGVGATGCTLRAGGGAGGGARVVLLRVAVARVGVAIWADASAGSNSNVSRKEGRFMAAFPLMVGPACDQRRVPAMNVTLACTGARPHLPGTPQENPHERL